MDGISSFSNSWVAKIASRLIPFFSIYWKCNILSSNITSNISDIADLRFSNLEIGKTYRLHAKTHLTVTDGSSFTILAKHGANYIMTLSYNASSSGQGDSYPSDTVTFVATATSIIFETVGFTSGDVATGNGTTNQTFSTLEELPNYIETDKWD